MNRKYNCLKLSLLLVGLLITASSYAAPVNVSINFTGDMTGRGGFTYDIDKSLCASPYCAPNEGDDFQGTQYKGVVEDFSFSHYTLITTTGAWFNPHAEEGGINKWGSIIPGSRGSNDSDTSSWVLSGAGSNYFDPTDQFEMRLSDSDPFKGTWSGFQFLPPSQGAPNGEFITTGGSFTLTTPIPATIWLFASGFVGLIGFRRKK